MTYVCDLRHIPVEDGRYGTVLLSQVLEHLTEPAEVLRELARVLTPGGRLWMSTPLFYEEHEQPYDFYRYTRFSLRLLLEEAGFDVEELEWLEGYLGTLSYQLRMAGDSLPVAAEAYGGGARGAAWAGGARLARPAARRVANAFARFDAEHPMRGVGMPKNYRAVAVRR